MANGKRLIDLDVAKMQFDDIPPFVGMTGKCVQGMLDDVPTVDAVEVPDCDKCYYNGEVSHWDQCEHCIGNTYRNNHFLSKDDVFCSDGERRTDHA